MSFKLFIRTRPLGVGIGLGNFNLNTVDYTHTGWQIPFQGIWRMDVIGGGGGSGAYNNSHAYSSEGGSNASTNTSTQFISSVSAPVIGGGGGKGTIVGITFNNGLSGSTTSVGTSSGGGSGGIASNGSPLTRYPSSFPFNIVYGMTGENYFFGTNSMFLYPSAQSGGVGKGGDGVYGNQVSHLEGLNGNCGYAQFTCVG